METKLPKYNIICLSNQLWAYPLWTNKKHVMTRLAEQGHNILFVDPPINTGRLFARQLIQKKWPLKRLVSKKHQDKHVTVLSPLNYIPSPDRMASSHVKLIKKAMEDKFDPKLHTLLWIYHVEIEGIKHYVEELNYDLLIYDCVDNYVGFPKYDTPEKKDAIIKQEKYLAEKADVIFATAPGLVEKLKKYNQHVSFTPNVGDYDKFIKVTDYKNSLPEDISHITRPRIGFTGAVDEYKFDRELVKKVAQDYPNYNFVIIGPMALKDREASIKELGFEEMHNVYFLGTKDYLEMPKYMAGFDVFIIPYQLNDYTVGGCFPVKFHEGLAAGLPVVVTNLPAYAPFADVCYVSKSYNEFSQNIRRAIEEDNDTKIKDRQRVAKENSWDGKVDKLLSIINSEFQKQ
jgi:glycosyltransferase involved in cell wall biosynthesis